MSTSQTLGRAATSQAPTPKPPLGPLAIDSTELLRGSRAITISHNGEVYRLQTTRQGKLILTK